MMNMKRSDDPLKSRTFSHKEVLFPSDRSVKRRSAKVLNMWSTPTSGRRLFYRRRGRSARIIRKIKPMQVLRDDLRPSPRGRARRAVHAWRRGG